MPIMKLGIGRCLQITYGKLKNDEYEKYITKLESCWVKLKFTAEGRRRRIRWRRGLRCRTQEQLRWRRESLVSGRSGRWEKKVYYSFFFEILTWASQRRACQALRRQRRWTEDRSSWTFTFAVSPTCEKAGIQDSSQTQSRSLTIDLCPHMLTWDPFCKALQLSGDGPGYF